ncbi:MAG: hypothetical protein RLZZ232_2527 [Planctomycetota bacterium]
MTLLRKSVATGQFFGWELRLRICDEGTMLTLRA